MFFGIEEICWVVYVFYLFVKIELLGLVIVVNRVYACLVSEVSKFRVVEIK